MDALSTIHPQAPGFTAGFLLALFIVFLVWLFVDRKNLKAQVAALEAKAAPALKAVEHDLHVVEAAPKVLGEDIKVAILKLISDAQAEAARVEAAKAAAPAPAAPAAPQA
jgi:hypothetical protein